MPGRVPWATGCTAGGPDAAGSTGDAGCAPVGSPAAGALGMEWVPGVAGGGMFADGTFTGGVLAVAAGAACGSSE